MLIISSAVQARGSSPATVRAPRPRPRPSCLLLRCAPPLGCRGAVGPRPARSCALTRPCSVTPQPAGEARPGPAGSRPTPGRRRCRGRVALGVGRVGAAGHAPRRASTTQLGRTTAPGRGASSSTISSTVTSARRAASTASFCTPVMPHICTLPRGRRCWAWTMVTSGLSAGTAASSSPVNGTGDRRERRGVLRAGRCRGSRAARRTAARRRRRRSGWPSRRGCAPRSPAAPASPARRRRASRCSEPTPGLPPHEKISLRAQPAPISWS